MLWIYFNGQGVAECVVNTGNRIRQGDSFQVFVTQSDERWTLTGVLYLKPGAESFVTINDEYEETTETFELGNPSQANSYFQNSISYEGHLITVPAEATSFEGNGGHVALQFQFLNSATGTYLHAQTVSVYVEPTYGLKATKITGADYATLVDMMTSSAKTDWVNENFLKTETAEETYLTISDAEDTYVTIIDAAQTYLAKQVSSWVYTQNSNGFQIGRSSANPSGGSIDEYMELRMISSTDTDVTDIGITELPTLWLSTDLIQHPDYSDDYSISAQINALGVKFGQGVDGEYTPTYIKFSDIETKSNASASYLAKSANGVTYTQNSNGSRLSNNYGSLLLYLPSSSAGNSSIFISETGTSNRAYLQSDSIKYTTSAGASWSTVRYSDIAVKSNSLFIEPNSGTIYTQNAQGFTVSGVNTVSGIPTVSAIVYTVNEPRFFVGLRDQSTQAETYGVSVFPDKITFKGQNDSSSTTIKFSEIGKHVEIGPFTSVSDLASALFEEDSHDYTVEDVHIYAVKSTTSSVTHMTMVNRRQCVYRIYTTKTPTASKHVSLYVKVYDDDFALVDYDNTTHGDLYAYIDL